jgi:hypothetical protein
MPGCELDNEADKAFALEESTPESTVSQGSFWMFSTSVMSISVEEHLDGLSHPFTRVKRCYGHKQNHMLVNVAIVHPR